MYLIRCRQGLCIIFVVTFPMPQTIALYKLGTRKKTTSCLYWFNFNHIGIQVNSERTNIIIFQSNKDEKNHQQERIFQHQ